MMLHSETKIGNLAERRERQKRQAIMEHLGDMMITAPYKPGHEDLGILDPERMTYEGWRLPAPWLNASPLRATVDIFGCVSRPTCFRVVYSERAPAPEETEIEVSRQEFDIDFKTLNNARIYHLPDPALLTGEPSTLSLHGEDAWKELQRVVGMSVIDA